MNWPDSHALVPVIVAGYACPALPPGSAIRAPPVPKDRREKVPVSAIVTGG